MAGFYHSLKNLLTIQIDEAALARLSWRDFGNGLSMARLERKDKKELVLYRISENAAPDAFLRHEHVGGEFYLVLKGRIEDENGAYGFYNLPPGTYDVRVQRLGQKAQIVNGVAGPAIIEETKKAKAG